METATDAGSPPLPRYGTSDVRPRVVADAEVVATVHGEAAIAFSLLGVSAARPEVSGSGMHGRIR